MNDSMTDTQQRGSRTASMNETEQRGARTSSDSSSRWLLPTTRDPEFDRFLAAQSGNPVTPSQTSSLEKDPCATGEYIEDQAEIATSSSAVASLGESSRALRDISPEEFVSYVKEHLENPPSGTPRTTTKGRIQATITYTPSRLTEGPVNARITFNHPDVEITNNLGQTVYSFRENGKFTFEFKDKYGTTGSALAQVDFIRSAPQQEQVALCSSCVAKCKGLRFDDELACIAMCTCGYRDSPLRDPKTSQGLGPLMRVKYCTVPTRNAFFQSRGTLIYSFEKVISEIEGVLRALDDSGELGIYAKQKEMLDSSTKHLNFAEMFTFSVESLMKTPPK